MQIVSEPDIAECWKWKKIMYFNDVETKIHNGTSGVPPEVIKVKW